jgi:CobQ-like glutamine amidotransferase family enzyme
MKRGHFGILVLASLMALGAPAAAKPPPAPARSVSEAASGVRRTTDEADLLEHGTYRNHEGNTVHSPAHSATGAVPAGASARCRDGTYSFSQHRSGTCSHHGGVAGWL